MLSELKLGQKKGKKNMKSQRMITSFAKTDGIVRIGDIGYFSSAWRERVTPKHFDNELAKKDFFVDGSAPLFPFGNANTVTESIVGHYPLMGYNYLVAQDGLTADTSAVFNLARLMDIRQLSFLTCPLHGLEGRTALYSHKRYGHMLDTMSIVGLIVRNNRAELTELAPSLGFASGAAG